MEIFSCPCAVLGAISVHVLGLFRLAMSVRDAYFFTVAVRWYNKIADRRPKGDKLR